MIPILVIFGYMMELIGTMLVILEDHRDFREHKVYKVTKV